MKELLFKLKKKLYGYEVSIEEKDANGNSKDYIVCVNESKTTITMPLDVVEDIEDFEEGVVDAAVYIILSQLKESGIVK